MLELDSNIESNIDFYNAFNSICLIRLIVYE